MPAFKNLIFDLGGVILDLSVDTTLSSFARVSGLEPAVVRSLFVSSAGFIEYEKGLIDDDAFRDFIRETYQVSVADDVIDACWNAMLLGIPADKLELLQALKKRYRVFLLSNTNAIHLRYINDAILQPLAGVNSLDRYFHRAYYSHEMKMRKPDAEIFQHVLTENDLHPADTLFLDDNADNIRGAASLGIQTLHVVTPSMVTNYFHD